MSTKTRARRPASSPIRRATPTSGWRRSPFVALGVVVGAAVVVLAVVFAISARNHSSGKAGAYHYAVGSPGPGATAPPVQLESTAGGQFDLAAQRGKTVLLYFQEGLSCQPCWDQMRDLEANAAAFTGLGIDQIVSITSDPIDQIRQKVAQDKIRTPVLSDPGLTVSRIYDATSYGMMGGTRDGHTFVLVGPDGTIRWRADYGGAPDYTMYVPSAALLADLRAGTSAQP